MTKYLYRSTNLKTHETVRHIGGLYIRYQSTVRREIFELAREIFELAMDKFINIKKRRDLTVDLKVRVNTGARNDFKI